MSEVAIYQSRFIFILIGGGCLLETSPNKTELSHVVTMVLEGVPTDLEVAHGRATEKQMVLESATLSLAESQDSPLWGSPALPINPLACTGLLQLFLLMNSFFHPSNFYTP